MEHLLTNETRNEIEQECGLINIKVMRVRRDPHGYPDLLLEGMDDSGFPFRGWLKEGEGVIDIRWHNENDPGWPEEVT